jgi:hypothetical protein
MKLSQMMKAIFLSVLVLLAGFDGLNSKTPTGSLVSAQCPASSTDWQGLGINLDWQRNNNYQSLNNARSAFSCGNYSLAFQWVCYGQRHNGSVVAAYQRCAQTNPNQFWFVVSHYW